MIYKEYLDKYKIVFETQKGCAMRCTGCERHKEKENRIVFLETFISCTQNALDNLYINGVKEVGTLYLYFMNMGEPSFNKYISKFLKNYLKNIVTEHELKVDKFIPVITTMIPKINPSVKNFIYDMAFIKNHTFGGEADINFNIYSIRNNIRFEKFTKWAMSIDDILDIFLILPDAKGRKYGLIFNGDIIDENDVKKIVTLFNNKNFMLKLEFSNKENLIAHQNIYDYLNRQGFSCILKVVKNRNE